MAEPQTFFGLMRRNFYSNEKLSRVEVTENVSNKDMTEVNKFCKKGVN